MLKRVRWGAIVEKEEDVAKSFARSLLLLLLFFFFFLFHVPLRASFAAGAVVLRLLYALPERRKCAGESMGCFSPEMSGEKRLTSTADYWRTR